MKLFLAHTLFQELLYLQILPFVPGSHNKMDKFLDIVALKKGNCANAFGTCWQVAATIWSSEIGPR